MKKKSNNAVRNGCIFLYVLIFIVMITKVVANLNGSEFGPVGGSTLRQQICSFYASIGGVAKSAFGDVLLDDKSVKSDLGHPNYRNKTCSFAAVKDVLEKGIMTKPMAHYGIHGKKQETGIISANIMIKGQPFKMDVVVIKNEDEILRVRCHDVYQTTLAENHQKGLITKRIRRTLIESPSCCPNGDSSAKVEQIIETTKDNNIKTKKYTYMNNKKQIRLTESDLHRIVNESVRRIIKEGLVDERPYRECMGYLEKAISAIASAEDDGSGRNDNLVSTLYKAYYACRDTALNGRMGSFDVENGYLSAGY